MFTLQDASVMRCDMHKMLQDGNEARGGEESDGEGEEGQNGVDGAGAETSKDEEASGKRDQDRQSGHDAMDTEEGVENGRAGLYAGSNGCDVEVKEEMKNGARMERGNAGDVKDEGGEGEGKEEKKEEEGKEEKGSKKIKEDGRLTFNATEAQKLSLHVSAGNR